MGAFGDLLGSADGEEVGHPADFALEEVDGAAGDGAAGGGAAAALHVLLEITIAGDARLQLSAVSAQAGESLPAGEEVEVVGGEVHAPLHWFGLGQQLADSGLEGGAAGGGDGIDFAEAALVNLVAALDEPGALESAQLAVDGGLRKVGLMPHVAVLDDLLDLPGVHGFLAEEAQEGGFSVGEGGSSLHSVPVILLHNNIDGAKGGRWRRENELRPNERAAQ